MFIAPGLPMFERHFERVRAAYGVEVIQTAHPTVSVALKRGLYCKPRWSGPVLKQVDVETTIQNHTLCLIQVATSGGTYLLDALELSDLGILAEVFADPAVVKVIHNATFERRVLATLGFELRGVCDTLVQSRRLRGRQVLGGHGLAMVCERELGLEGLEEPLVVAARLGRCPRRTSLRLRLRQRGDFDAAIRARPDFAGAHNNRGLTLHELDRSLEALDAYDKALALQNWFRSEFEYSLEVQRGHSDDAIWADVQRRQAGAAPAEKSIKQIELETLLSQKDTLGDDQPDGDFYARRHPLGPLPRPAQPPLFAGTRRLPWARRP